MREELDQALCRDFPNVFADRFGKSTPMSRGFNVDDGWEPIIREAAAKIETEILKLSPEEQQEAKAMGYYMASQVKEKFGTLRFYLTSGTKTMYDAAEEAERKSESICEQCGQPGELRGKHWLYTACVEHTKSSDL